MTLRAITIAQPFASLMASGRLNQLVVPFKVPRQVIGQYVAIHVAVPFDKPLRATLKKGRYAVSEGAGVPTNP